MSTSQTLGGATRCGRVIGPSLDKIIKNAAWRKHTYLVSSCKSVLDKLESLPDDFHDPSSVVAGLSSPDADAVLQPFLFSLDTAYSKVVEPALDCAFKLFSLSVIRGEIQSSKQDSVLFKLVNAVSKVGAMAEEPIQLAVLRVLLAAVRSPCVLIRGDCLLHVVKTCYNIYLGGLSGTTQICAKSVLAQMMLVIFTRSEEDSLADVAVKTVYVNELLAFTDKSVNEGSSVYFCQGFVNEVMAAGQGSPPPPPDVIQILLQNPETETVMTPDSPSFRGYEKNGEADSLTGDMSKMRQDAFLLFKNLCKLSMRFSSQEKNDDQIMVRGKTLSLELLKVIIDNGGPVWRSNESFISAVKQYLCLSLLKNSAVSIMSIFQLQCAIFMSLLSKLRSVLKAEIGIFFPMIVLRVLENVLQPSFLQKMTVLNLLEKMSQDPQLIVDIFVNYDCDVDSSNILERIVNGLLKTALGPPTGSSTTLSPAQDSTFRNESVKILVNVVKAMGSWMDQQLKMDETVWPKGSQIYASMDSNASQIGEEDCDTQPDTNPEAYDASMLEQRRAYKIELQKGISLFNRKPSKGIDFLISSKKIGNSPEEVASFLMKTAGLNGTVIGDYLGEREELPLKVMHAYVDSFNFQGKDFVEAIRFFLRGFRLPGEAQKIDRIMEKFAEHYWKCNPGSFTSADTAYVLAYSVIMLNTDAHNNMVKDKMSKADFVRNNRGIDDGKDLPEEYLGSLYDRVVKDEIKMNSDTLAPQSKQVNGLNKLLGLDSILNLVSWMQPDEKAHGANRVLIRDIQEQFQAKSEKSESAYHSVTDVSILRFILEVSWGPMLAAFSVTLDQSDDRLATSLCLQGFRYAVHVTAVMGMQTQRDAFVTSMAKFTNLHCAADMKQKNIDAVKAIITIAIEDGNHLQGSWEHILTCLSRIEHLQLLGEGSSPADTRYIPTTKAEVDEKKALGFPHLKKRGALQNPSVMAVVRGGSYDSTSLVKTVPKLVKPEQIKNFIANLNLLDQIGNFELNHVYANSQRLNSEAIVAFVKALCKVSMSELQSPADPRVFSLTKLVETAHYNMNRIRLVWSRIWNVLSDFFVSVGLSENLSVAIFVMDSLRQLSMKFLERKELANYHFQHEFLRPFVVVMQNSSSAEIRELIVRCVSQMVLSRVSNVQSGWKSVFTVFTTAAIDERRNIVLLAFETIEKIVRDHFHCITETEISVYADCIICLITFTNSKFEGDIGFNTIEFLRFCAVKLAEGGLFLNEKLKNDNISALKEDSSDGQSVTELDEQVSYWVPLLSGLSKQASDRRPAIRKRSIEVLFNILMDHGHLFTRPFWAAIFSSIILPVFNNMRSKTDMLFEESSSGDSPSSASLHTEETTWDAETSTLALQLLVDLLANFFSSVRSQLSSVVSIILAFIKSPVQGSTGSGISVLLRLADGLARSASEDEWTEVFLALKEAASLTFAGFMKVLRTMDDIEDVETSSGQSVDKDDLDDDNLHIMSYVVSRTKKHIDVLSQIVEVVSELYRRNQYSLPASHVDILADIFSCIASHAQQLNTDTVLRRKFKRACSVQNLTQPQLLNFENEANKSYMTFLQDMVTCNPDVSKELELESRLVTECSKVVKIYLNCTGQHQQQTKPIHWILPMGFDRTEEAKARTSLLVSSLEALCSLEAESLKRHVASVFPLLVDLVKTEHCSPQVPYALSNVLKSCIGPILG
ncbi:hypothetical protein BRARA_A00294 [Brassica rapa]|uniref:SEC7 domain-containing protein n=2 Tax=Brassica campestris TaxID=3711 RepID=A0A398AKX4_BRACM|nr:hypothetical protein BRARA_A00294 [Brassica rapa]